MKNKGHIEYLFSHKTENLVSRFIENLNKETKKEKDPFFAPLVLVPNPSVSTYLKHELVESQEITANIEFTYLERFLFKNAGLEKKAAEIGDITLKVAEFFSDKKKQKNYLVKTRTDESRTGADIAHESRRLARLFLDYERSRPEIIEQWEECKKLCPERDSEQKKKSTKEIARAEGEIYRYVFNGEDSESYFCSRDLFKEAEFKAENRTIHIFAITHFSELHAGILKKLAVNNNIIFYHLNPFCLMKDQKPDIKYFIADKKKKNEDIKNRTSALSFDWGFSLFEKYQLINDKLDQSVKTSVEILSDDDDHFKSGKAENMLQLMQKHLLTGKTEKIKQDTSLQIFSARGIYREVETLHNHIKHLLQNVDNLKVDDILILVPDITKYSRVIDYVFKTDQKHRLYFNLLDSETGRDTGLIKAFSLFSDMVLNDITREALIEYATTGAVQRAYHINNDDVDVFLKVIDYLNIYRENIKEHAPVYSWSKGLQRLRLSVVYGESVDSDSEVFVNGLPDGLHLLNEEQLMKFNRVITDILSLRENYKAGRALAEWAVELTRLFETNFIADENDRLESAVSRQLTLVINRLQNYDETQKEQQKHSFSFIKTYLLDELSEVKAGRGRYRAGGITVSTFRPMRPVPFKVIYMAGLNEGDFPGSEQFNRLDLRNRYKRTGDLTARESNEYLFLETLLCARERLIFSYIGKDDTQDKEYLPSPVLQRLLMQLKEFLKGENSEFIIPETPVRPDSSLYFNKDFVEKNEPTITDIFIAADGSGNKKVVQYNAEYAEAGKARAQKNKPEGGKVKERISLFEPLPADNEKTEVLEISLYDLFEYLKDPALHRLKKDYRIDAQKPVFNEEKILEPFLPEKRDLTNIYKSVLTDVFTGKKLPATVDDLLDNVKKKSRQRGGIPFLTGWQIAAKENQAEVQKLLDFINDQILNKQGLKKYQSIKLADNQANSESMLFLSPYEIKLKHDKKEYIVKLTGKSDFMGILNRQLLGYSAYELKFTMGLPEKNSLQSLIAGLILSILLKSESLTYYYVLAEQYQRKSGKFQAGDYKGSLPIDKNELDQLQQIIPDWLENLVHDYLFETDYIEAPYELFIKLAGPYSSKDEAEIKKVLNEVPFAGSPLRQNPVDLQPPKIYPDKINQIYKHRIEPLKKFEELK